MRFGKSRRLKILSLLALSLLFFDAVVYATGYTQDLTETLTGAINAVNHLTSPSETLSGCFNDTTGGGCLATVTPCTSGCAVQPVTSSMANGATAANLILSGTGLNVTTIPSNGKTHYILMKNDTALTLTEPTDGATSRYRFTSMVTTETGSACHVATSGTDCTLWTAPTNYLQYSDTFKAAYTGTAPATGAPEHCAQAGAAATIGDLTTAGISGWCDYGSVAYAQAFAPGGSSTQQYSAVPLTQGLVGSWPLQEGTGTSAFDLSHNNNTGTLENSPTWSSTGGPFAGTGYLNFSTDKNQYISVADSSALRPASITVAAWVYASSFPDSYNAVVSKETSGQGYTLLVKSTGKLAVYLNGGPSCNYDGSGLYALSTSTWYFLAFTYSSGTLIGYVNGVQDASVACTNAALNGATGYPLIIGGSVAFTPRWWNGRLAGVSFYDRALSASEVSELYASTLPVLEHQITSPSNTYTWNYYHQYAEAPYYTAISGSPSGNALNYYYSSLGQSLTDTMGTSAATIWADAATVTVGDHYVSSTERYSSDANTTLTSASTTGPKISVYHQFNQPTKIAYPDGGTTAVSLTCPNWGTNTALALTTSTQNEWADSGGTCSVPATTSIVSGASRLSMGPTYSWSVSKSGSVPSVLDGYLQYFLDDASGIGVSGQNNGTAYAPTGSAWFDHGTVTAAGLSTNSYALNAASWLYQVSPAGYQVLSNSSLSPVPSLSADTLSWTASGPVKWSLYDPSSSGYVVQTVNDNGVATAFSGPTSSGSGNVYTASGSSPWTIDLAATGTAPNNSPGGGGYVPPSCAYGTNATTGFCNPAPSVIPANPTASPPTALIDLAVLAMLAVAAVVLIAGRRKELESDFKREAKKDITFRRPKKK
ncbi:MAG: LamG domain-containing protein [Nitrososphaerota archaeon]|nr:LamG domain-containing protein [Nitrososphaerota archaeon]